MLPSSYRNPWKASTTWQPLRFFLSRPSSPMHIQPRALFLENTHLEHKPILTLPLFGCILQPKQLWKFGSPLSPFVVLHLCTLFSYILLLMRHSLFLNHLFPLQGYELNLRKFQECGFTFGDVSVLVATPRLH